MTVASQSALLLPPSLTDMEILEQQAASDSLPSRWVRGAVGEKTLLPAKDSGTRPALQLRIQLPNAPLVEEAVEPPPPPQVLFRAREVIRPPKAEERSQAVEETVGAPGTHVLDPVDAPPGLADHAPGLEESDVGAPPVRPPDMTLAQIKSEQSVERVSVPVIPPVRPMVEVALSPNEEEQKPLSRADDPLEESSEPAPLPGDVHLPGFEEELSPMGPDSDPPGLGDDELDELEADMALFDEFDATRAMEEDEDDTLPWPEPEPVEPSPRVQTVPSIQAEDAPELPLSRANTAVMPQRAEPLPLPRTLDSPGVVPVREPVQQPSATQDAFEQVWGSRPLSERLAAGSLAGFGLWAVWRVWSVL